MNINMGDILVTFVVFIIFILIISLTIIFFKKFGDTKKQRQIINQKLDKILEKLEEKNK